MNIENTCRCKQELILKDVFSKDRAFIKGREYQVDIEVTNLCNTYKVYLTGEWEPSWILSQQEFEEYFELIK